MRAEHLDGGSHAQLAAEPVGGAQLRTVSHEQQTRRRIFGDAGKHLHDGVDPLDRPKVRDMYDELRRRVRREPLAEMRDVSTAIDIAIEAIRNHFNRPLHLQFTASRVAKAFRYRRDAVRLLD